MSKVLTFKPRHQEVRAMRIILGETTATQIRDFCPAANVGTPWTADLQQGDEKDIRWVSVPNGAGEPAHMQEDGDWLVQLGSGRHEILSDAEFHTEYEAAE